jgi:hypothetical protein
MDDRPWTELLGLPAIIFVLALVAFLKGIFEENLGFTIVGAVVGLGVFLAIGLSMTIAKRE